MTIFMNEAPYELPEDFLWVDLNEVEEYDDMSVVHTLRDFAPKGMDVAVGSVVTLGDFEGNRFTGKIVEEDEMLITVQLLDDETAE